MSDVVNNRAESRYELAVDGDLAIAVYERRGDVLAFTHTAVPERLEGHGIATRLVKGALADVRAKGERILPLCPFVADYLDRNPEDVDLVANEGD